MSVLGVVALVGSGPSVAQKPRTQLVVHSTLEPDNIAVFKQAFEAENPDI
jgi:hypothetical protein